MTQKRRSSLFYSGSHALLTDLYQLTMAHSYWKSGMLDHEAVFHLFFRRLPFQGGFAVAAGLESLVDFVETFRFDADDLDYLRGLEAPGGGRLFPDEFLDYLGNLRLTVDIDAVPEGTLVFPQEPLVRVQGPLLQCQLLESVFLNLINFPTLIATKAARLRLAAGQDRVLEFGFRRAQGPDGALSASRSAYVGGCDATSNVLAGKLFGIPVSGTVAHSWIMAFDSELEAFDAYAKAMPNNVVLLVDTYDSLEGVRHAVEIAKRLEADGKRLLGVRLDSGDLSYLSIEARRILDAAGFEDCAIVASNELDEFLVSELKRQGAQINVWGVGTNLVTAKGNSALDGVYKLSSVRAPNGQWQHKLKLSEQLGKVSTPGRLQVRRYRKDGCNVADAIYDIDTDISKGCAVVDPLDRTRHRHLGTELKQRDLLQPVFREGNCCMQLPDLATIRAHAQEELAHLHPSAKRFVNPHPYVVGLESSLYNLKLDLIEQIRHQK